MEFLAFTIVLALVLNCLHWQSLILTLIVGIGVLVVVPTEYGAGAWYSMCISIELTILLFCLLLKSSISIPVGLLSILFAVVHVLGYIFDGSTPDSPYHYFARSIEYTEVLSCVLMSYPVVHYLKGKTRCLMKY